MYRKISSTNDAGKGYIRPLMPLAWAIGQSEVVVSSGELSKIIYWYPIAFQKINGSFQMVMPFSVPGDPNPLINSVTGKWIGRYLPISLKVYPFSVEGHGSEIRSDDSGLLIDEAAEDFFSLTSSGQMLAENGAPTNNYLETVRFLNERNDRLQKDAAIIAVLEAQGLLKPWELNFGTAETPKIRNDLYQIDVALMNSLDAGKVVDLFLNGGAHLIYGHIYSRPRAIGLSRFLNKSRKLEVRARTGRQGANKAASSDFIDFSDDDFEIGDLIDDD